jgi:hypothetical protein
VNQQPNQNRNGNNNFRNNRNNGYKQNNFRNNRNGNNRNNNYRNNNRNMNQVAYSASEVILDDDLSYIPPVPAMAQDNMIDGVNHDIASSEVMENIMPPAPDKIEGLPVDDNPELTPVQNTSPLPPFHIN